MSANSDDKRLPAMIFAFCLVLLAVEAVVFYGKIADAREECSSMEKIAARRSERLKELETEKAYLETYIDRMLKDPEFLKTEIRSRLGYSEEGEIVIRPEGSPAAGAPSRR